MPNRSQRHKAQVHGYRPVIANILPDTATLTAAGAIGRTIATLSAVGGVAPLTYAFTANGGLSAQISGNLLVTTADPCGAVGLRTPQITVTDDVGQTKTETINVTLT
jgi:hypothetical protein